MGRSSCEENMILEVKKETMCLLGRKKNQSSVSGCLRQEKLPT